MSSARLSLKTVPLSTIVLTAGFVALLIPTIASLANQTWSREFGAYGPIVLVTGLWLLWRQIPELRHAAQPGSIWLTAPILAVALVCYVFGYAYDFVTLETAGVYGAGVAILQSRVGLRPLLKHWFPLLYLAFAIPPPNSLLADVTAPLKSLVSLAATDWLSAFGLPVAREGVTIFVGQYQLLVEDACSGMNSIVGLIAVSLLYIYLMRGSSWVYSVILVGFIIPIAIVANIIRIMVLILLTYYFGNEVAQGFLHFTAGMLLFTTALLCVFGLDRLLALGQSRFGRRA
jgi:exosortase